jgi:hypothetical protein
MQVKKMPWLCGKNEHGFNDIYAFDLCKKTLGNKIKI